jgi:hypothetical protein
MRKRLIDLATTHQPPYRVPKGAKGQYHKLIFSRRLLKPEDYQDAALGDIEARIRARWADFTERELPVLVAPIYEAAGSIAMSSADGEAIGVTASELGIEEVGDRGAISGGNQSDAL